MGTHQCHVPTPSTATDSGFDLVVLGLFHQHRTSAYLKAPENYQVICLNVGRWEVFSEKKSNLNQPSIFKRYSLVEKGVTF